MRKYEPDFDLFSFENEVDEVLRQLLNYFFQDDLDSVQKLSADIALGQLTGIIRTRKEMVSLYVHSYRELSASTRRYCISRKPLI